MSFMAHIIQTAAKELGLYPGFSNRLFCATTEAYPGSPKVDDENCVHAQVAAICSGLGYVQEGLRIKWLVYLESNVCPLQTLLSRDVP